MNFLLVYVSPNGTTRITSEILKDVIESDGHLIELIDIGRRPYRENFNVILEKLKEADIAGFGSPAYHMDMLDPMKILFRILLSGGDNYKFKAFLYLNYAGITSGRAFLNAAKSFEQVQIPVIGAMKAVAPHFHHKEKFPTESTRDFIKMFYHDMKVKDFAAIPGNLLSTMLSPQKSRVKFLYPLVHFIGKKRELQININHESCRNCGKCENECPVGAINLSPHANIDFAKCIHCYHCTVACKLNAVVAPVEKLDKMIKINKRIIGIENPQNQIYI